MRHLREADVVGALALVADAGAVETLDEFPRCVLPRLRVLLGADLASFTHNADGRTSWLWEPEDELHGLGPLMEQRAGADPFDHPLIGHFVRSGDVRAVRVSDLLGLREFQRLELYQTVFRQLGARYQLAAGIALEGPMPSGLGFTRAGSDFTERERTLLDLIRPHLGMAYRSVAARTDARRRLKALEQGLEAGGRALAVVRDGRLVPLSERAAPLLRRWFGTAEPELPAPGARLELERPDARLRVRTVDGSLVLLDETRFAPDPERARVLGLTRREAEVVAHVARGLSDGEIARALTVSVRTVEKHLENVYRKLGVSSRTEAAARLLGA